jgi:hypothetical protein
MPGYKENSSFPLFHEKYSHSNIQNNQSTNLQNYTAHPSLLTQILMERGALLRQNSLKNLRTYTYVCCKKLLLFLCTYCLFYGVNQEYTIEASRSKQLFYLQKIFISWAENHEKVNNQIAHVK